MQKKFSHVVKELAKKYDIDKYTETKHTTKTERISI
jgi:hypothetical protein